MIIPFARGIGFAIPVNVVKTTAEVLIRKGRIVRPWIGLSTMKITKAIAENYDLSIQEGLVVIEVATGSPAEVVGIEPGDLIVKIDDKSIKESQDFAKSVRSKSVGSSVTLTIMRDGRQGIVDLNLGETPTPHIPSRNRKRLPFPLDREAM